MCGLTGTVKMPSQRASICVGMSDQELEVHLHVPKRVGWPGSGVRPDFDLRAPTVRVRSFCPSALLLSAGKGAHSISTPSVAKLEKGQGMKEDDPDPNLSSQAPGTGEDLCVCVMCMHVGLRVRVCFPGLCVSLCTCSPAPHPGLPLSCGPLSSGNKAGFPVPRDGERCPGCTGVGWGCGSKRRGRPGERSPFCAKSLSAIWGPHVQHDCPCLEQGPSPNCLGFRGQRLRNFLGSPACVLGRSMLWDWGSMGTQILVLGDGAGEPETWPSPAFSLSRACSRPPNPCETCKGWQKG